MGNFSFYLSLNCLKEFRQRACFRKRAVTRDNSKECELGVADRGHWARPACSKPSVCPWVSAWHGNHWFASMCPSHLPVNCPPPWCSPIPYPLLLSSGWHMSLNCLTACGSQFLWGPRTYVIKFIFLLLICLMFIWLPDQPENLEGYKQNYSSPTVGVVGRRYLTGGAMLTPGLLQLRDPGTPDKRWRNVRILTMSVSQISTCRVWCKQEWSVLLPFLHLEQQEKIVLELVSWV